MIISIKNVQRTISSDCVFPYQTGPNKKRERRTIFELSVYLKLMASKAKFVKGCCASTVVVDALGSSSRLRKRTSDGGTLTEEGEVLAPFQTIPGQPSKVRAIDEKPCPESQFAKDIVMVDQIRRHHGLKPIGTQEFWAMTPIERIKTESAKFMLMWLGEERPSRNDGQDDEIRHRRARAGAARCLKIAKEKKRRKWR